MPNDVQFNHGKTDCILVTKSRLNSIISLVIFVDRALGVCRKSKNRECRDTVATGPSTTSLLNPEKELRKSQFGSVVVSTFY